jgi:hypothetical protein
MTYIPQEKNFISTNNSLPTGTGLGAGETWQGVVEEVSQYGRAGIAVFTPFGTVTDGVLWIEVSHDGVNFGGPARIISDSSTAQPHMWAIVEKYMRLKYVNGSTPTGTNFSIQTQYSVNDDILLGHPLHVVPKDEHEGLLTKSVGWGTNPSGLYEPIVSDGLGFSTTTLLGNGATYSSGVLDMSKYTQVQTDVLSDKNGTITVEFSSEATGVDVVRSLSIPYVGGSGFKMFSAPAFTPYVKYQFTCNEVGQADFYFDTKFTTKAISGQILGMEDFIATGMVANLGRSVIVGQEPDGTYSNQKIDGEAFITGDVLGIGGVYTSPVVSVHGFSQIETGLFADQVGTLLGRWYTDEAKTTLTRTFTRPLSADEVGEMQYFAAPAFGDYLEYEYTNGGVAQGQFNLELHLRTKAVSGQILNVDGFIGDNMAANLDRSIVVGKQPNGN